MIKATIIVVGTPVALAIWGICQMLDKLAMP